MFGRQIYHSVNYTPLIGVGYRFCPLPNVLRSLVGIAPHSACPLSGKRGVGARPYRNPFAPSWQSCAK